MFFEHTALAGLKLRGNRHGVAMARGQFSVSTMKSQLQPDSAR